MPNAITKKVIIGTTKFGMPYGVFNQVQVASTEVEKIVNLAQKNGISCFDTAPEYGDAEKLIGIYADQVSRENSVTKVAKVSSSEVRNQDISRIDECFKQSLKLMKTRKCYGLLVHDVHDLYKPGYEKLVAWMNLQRELGVVQKIGASVYTPKEAEELYKTNKFNLIQIPCSVFDQRFHDSGVLHWLTAQGVEIHARSLFMKGVLAKSCLSVHELEGEFPNSLLEHTKAFHQFLTDKNCTSYEICINYMKNHEDINRWIVGISSEEQLQRLINALDNEHNSINLENWAFDNYPVLDPRAW
jgi:aryl-alcohol dehydrogenase-like predicted oxidoreductase